MALVESQVRDPVARALFGGRGAADLADDEALRIDTGIKRSLAMIEQVADNVQMAGASDNAPSEWEPWFFHEAVFEAGQFIHPDRASDFRRNATDARVKAILDYQGSAVDYDLSSDAEYATLNPQNIRRHVMRHCAKLPRPFFPDMKSIDTAMLEILNSVWNRAGWVVRQRTVRLKIDVFSFTGATWSRSARTITKTGEMAEATVGSIVLIEAGTSAVKREFTCTATDNDSLTVASDIGADDAATDIAGKVVTVSFENIPAGESFDSVSSVRWYYVDADGRRAQLRWIDSDRFVSRKSGDGSGTARPMFYRTNRIGSSIVWNFAPFPDQDYFAIGEILIATPANAVSATDTKPFDALWAESHPTIKRAIYDRVLTNHGRHDTQIHREVLDEIEQLFPAYQDPGAGDNAMGVQDVYHDAARTMSGSAGHLGGGL